METILKEQNLFILNQKEQQEEATRTLREVGDFHTSVSLSHGEETVTLPDDLSGMVIDILRTISRGGAVSIKTIPDFLSANTAADMLNISRPTFLKLACEKNLPFEQVGSHKRFHTQDVMRLRSEQKRRQLEAFREFNSQLADLDLED